MAAEGLKITITQAAEGEPVHTEIWCASFVDHGEHYDPEAALVWVRERLDGADPFEEYSD